MTATLQDSAHELAKVLERCQTFLLSGHVNIDGDSLGSMLGMYYYLRARGKKVRALAFEPLMERYSFLHGERAVEIFDPVVHAAVAHDVECFMMFDFSSISRMPGLWDMVREGSAFTVCVDHHRTEERPADLNIQVPSAPATGKIVLELIRALGGAISPPIAEALLVAISTDTGWFRYSNTTPQVLQDAAELLGSDPGLAASAIYREIYQRNDVALIRLIGRVAADLRAELDGRLLWATIPMALVDELGVGVFETDELLDLMRTGRDAECVALLRELPGNEIRVNLRSHGKIDVSELAREIGGGGHVHSAGATLRDDLESATQRVIGKLRQAVARQSLRRPTKLRSRG